MVNKRVCVGAGLISLDILLRDDGIRPISYYVGGTCGNVMMILSYMGWDACPIARLDNSKYTERLLADMRKFNINTQYISTENGRTPVIIQRNIIDKDGHPTHKFECRGNDGRFYLNFSSLTKKQAQDVLNKIDFVPNVFFFDRVSPAIIDMAKAFKSKGSLIYFEPSCKISEKHFDECVELADVIKFAEQRISNLTYFDDITNTIIIQTLGENGLKFRYDSTWITLPPVPNDDVVDTVGAGDWTTAAFIYQLYNNTKQNEQGIAIDNIKSSLEKAQKIGSRSCSYEGARGMMILPFNSLKHLL